LEKLSPLTKSLPTKLQQRFIANAVDTTIRQHFPTKYCGLCYLYAIVGSNVLSIILERSYQPVGGIAIIDAGGGQFLELVDVEGFTRERGGTFHCWIESSGLGEVELIDFTFRHNSAYARSLGLKWRAKKQTYLWGLKKDLLLTMDQSELPEKFPENKVWYRGCDEGTVFLRQYLINSTPELARLTMFALKSLYVELKSHLAKRPHLIACYFMLPI
jgi:hypothetical protein